MNDEYICNIYVALINKGLKTIADVPIELQEAVLDLYDK